MIQLWKWKKKSAPSTESVEATARAVSEGPKVVEALPQTFREVYPLNEPYAYAAITRDPSSGLMKYIVIEPALLEEEKQAIKRIKEILVQELDVDLNVLDSKEKAEQYLKEKVRKLIKTYRIKIAEESLGKILYYIVRDFIYLGKIDPLMRDHMIEDISCDGPGVPIYIWHREYESIPTNVIFESPDELDNFVIKLAYLSGRHISIAQPVVDAALPDGSRVQLTFSKEVTQRGSTFTVRKFRADPLTITDLIILNTISAEMAAFFWFAIENKASILVAGGTASGKTTSLNCLAMFIRPELKVVTIEDTPELNLPHENWIAAVARTGFGAGAEGGPAEITLFDLLKASFRQRPDYIIVGEIRGAEAFTLFQAVATGHGGLSSIHADSVESVIHRLESEPMNIPRSLITSMDIISVQLRTRIRDRTVRRIINVTEIVGLDSRTNELLTNEAFRWNVKTDTFQYSGRSYLLEKIMKLAAYSPEYVKEELERRKVVLEWMAKTGIRRYMDVAQMVRKYYIDPKRVYEQAKLGLLM
jgi:flagellar protein FlaI